jgi:RNA 3'-terminal phosphate cyclase (ATP)
MIEIDGSYGEGGGQILRTALGLSAILRKPFRIYNIRKNRKNPGLRPQHLMCVQALKKITGARVEGCRKGSTELVFEPQQTTPGNYSFDIGTAGSITLLLQAIMPPLVYSSSKSRLVLKGGTHVPFSPPYHYLKEVFLAFLKRLGINIETEVERYGFYPKGGGIVNITVEPATESTPLECIERGTIREIKGISGVGNLPMHIAERQRDSAYKLLLSEGLKAEIETVKVSSLSEGSFIFLRVVSNSAIAGFSALGERGKRAERVGQEAVKALLEYYRSNACLDPHLSDQILLYLAVSEGSSTFSTSCVTKHLLTNLWVIGRFVDMEYTVEGELGKKGIVKLKTGGIKF